MACEEIKPPEPPEMSNIPDGIKLPRGLSLSDIKSKASAKLSDPINGAQNMIESGIKKLGSALSPEALSDRVGSIVDGVAGEITGIVDGAIDGVMNIKNQLKKIDPSVAFNKIPGSPGAVTGKIKGKLTGRSEFSNLQGSLGVNKCGNEYIKQASQANKDIKDIAGSATKGISGKERLKAARDPVAKMQMQEKINKQVTDSVKSSKIEQATKDDKEKRTSQDALQSDELQTTLANPAACESWIFSWAHNIFGNVFRAVDYCDTTKYNEQFRKFGIFGSNMTDTINALQAIRAPMEEYVANLRGMWYCRQYWESAPCVDLNDWRTIDIRNTKITGTYSDSMNLGPREIPLTLQQVISYHWDFAFVKDAFPAGFYMEFISRWFDPTFRPTIRSLNKVKTPKEGVSRENGSLFASWTTIGAKPEKELANFHKVVRQDSDQIKHLLRRDKEKALEAFIELGEVEAVQAINSGAYDSDDMIIWRDLGAVTDVVPRGTIYFSAKMDWNDIVLSDIKPIPGAYGDFLDW